MVELVDNTRHNAQFFLIMLAECTPVWLQLPLRWESLGHITTHVMWKPFCCNERQSMYQSMTRVLDGSLLAHSQVQRGGGGERAWFQPFAHVLNCGRTPPLPHTIIHVIPILFLRITLSVDILWQHMSCKETRSITLIQQSIWSYKWKMWTSEESIDETERIPNSKTIAKGNLGFHCTLVCPFCWKSSLISSARKAVG